MFAELSEGFKTMLSTPVNTGTLSLHLWKALKIFFVVLAGIHAALGLQDICRSEYTTPLSSHEVSTVSGYWHYTALLLRLEVFSATTGSEDCSRNFTASNGTIESPGFPDKYPHNLDCIFTIIAKPKTEILLHFLLFDLEHDPLQAGEGDCKYDWLDIWDGIPQGKSWGAALLSSASLGVSQSSKAVQSVSEHQRCLTSDVAAACSLPLGHFVAGCGDGVLAGGCVH